MDNNWHSPQYARVKRRYGTNVDSLNPADIKVIGSRDGRFYVSEHEWHDFAAVLRDMPHELTWIGSPGWFARDRCRGIYNWLNERYDLSMVGTWARIQDLPTR